jgi:3-oxoacyl-[acyl-carrier protein] reductase
LPRTTQEGAPMTNNAGEHARMGPGLGRLSGQVAVVTGAESGIGRATARLFAREGAKVVCADVAERGDPRTDRLIESDGGEAHFLLGDVSQKAVCEEMVSTAIDRFGGLYVAFFNAGTGVRKKLHEMSDEEWDHVINLNLYGVYHGVQAVLPHFMEQGHGNIVITASSFGLRASPRYPSYSATKAALVNLTRQLAVDYGPEIRINCVCPGLIKTELTQKNPVIAAREPELIQGIALHRTGGPRDVAELVAFLATVEPCFVTGQDITIDGFQWNR